LGSREFTSSRKGLLTWNKLEVSVRGKLREGEAEDDAAAICIAVLQLFHDFSTNVAGPAYH
jgi:hypothetical protein